MRLSFTFALVFLTTLCCLSQNRGATALNDPDTPAGNTYAIVIGISKYKNLPPLQYADRDAQSFYDYLVSKEGMNVDSVNVALCINMEANINNLGNQVSDILQKDIKKGDKVIFFFAGHGDYDAKIMKDQSLLLLQGAPNGNYFQNVFSGDYISTSDLHIKFTSELIKKGAEVMLIIDACHSGGMNSMLAGGEQGGIITANALNTIQSTVKLYSCRANQYSLESTQFGGGRGLFSYILMEGLYGLADANNDKVVSMIELQRYLEDNVPMMALPNKQDPVIKTEDNTMVICKVNENLLTEYKTAKERNLSFLLAANIKGNEDTWLAAMSITQKELYQNCKKQLENKNLNEAYTIYKQYELQDKTSEASILLRRNLSAALQEGASIILSPMLEDVSKFNSYLGEVAQARDYLEKATELLGKEHFLYDKLQARKLYLKTLVIILKGEDKKRSKECIQYLEESVSLEPNAPYSYFSLSGLYSAEGNNPAAASNMKKYLDLIPNSLWAHNNYGVLLHDLKNLEEAEKEYKKSIELDPDYATAHYNYGILLKDLKRYDEAEREYIKASEIDPAYVSPHYNYGILLTTLKRWDDAEKEYKRAIEIDPAYVNAHYNLAILYFDLKRYDEAEKEYSICIKLDPNFTDAYYNYGILLTNLERYEEATTQYENSISLNPVDATAHYNYANLLKYLNRADEAEKEYLAAIELNPNYVNAHFYYGNLLYNLKRYTAAEKEYKKAIELDPGNAGAHQGNANCLTISSNYEEAEKEYKKAIELNPTDPYVYSNFCFLLLDSKRYEEAITSYLNYTNLSLDYAFGYKQIAEIYYTNLKQYDSSAFYYQKLFNIDKKDTSSLERYAYSLLRLNKVPESIQAFETETEQFPGHPWGYYNLACVYSLQNNNENAISYLDKALQNGMRMPEHWQIDNDLDNIRTRPEFKALLLRDYTQEELDKYPDLFVVKKQD